jgi:hypothetical protein
MKALLCTTSLVIAFAGPATSETIRSATFNASMNRADPGALKSDLESGTNGQIQALAETIQRVDPDVLLVNEFDYDPDNPALFAANYLSVPQNVSGRARPGRSLAHRIGNRPRDDSSECRGSGCSRETRRSKR